MAESAITGNESTSDSSLYETPALTHQAIDKLSAAYLVVQNLRRHLLPGELLTDDQLRMLGDIEASLADLGKILEHMHQSQLPDS